MKEFHLPFACCIFQQVQFDRQTKGKQKVNKLKKTNSRPSASACSAVGAGSPKQRVPVCCSLDQLSCSEIQCCRHAAYLLLKEAADRHEIRKEDPQGCTVSPVAGLSLLILHKGSLQPLAENNDGCSVHPKACNPFPSDGSGRTTNNPHALRQAQTPKKDLRTFLRRSRSCCRCLLLLGAAAAIHNQSAGTAWAPFTTQEAFSSDALLVLTASCCGCCQRNCGAAVCRCCAGAR